MRFIIAIFLCTAPNASHGTLYVAQNQLLRVDSTRGKIVSVQNARNPEVNMPSMVGEVSLRRANDTTYLFSRLDKAVHWSVTSGATRWNELIVGPIFDGTTIAESLYVYSVAGKRNRFTVHRIVKGKVVDSWQSLGEPALRDDGVSFITGTGMLAMASSSKPTLQLFRPNIPVSADARMLGSDGRVAVFKSDEWIYRFTLTSRKLQRTKLRVFGQAIVVNGSLICGEMEGKSLVSVVAWDGKLFKRIKLGINGVLGIRFVSDGHRLFFIARGRGSEKSLFGQISLKSPMSLVRSEMVMGSIVQRDSLALWRGRLWIDMSTGRLESFAVR